MKPKPPDETPKRIGWKAILGYGVLVLALGLTPYLAHRWGRNEAMVLALFGFFFLVAWGLRSRLVICTLLGTVLGAMFVNPIHHGTIESRIWDLPVKVIGGALIGLTVGVLWHREQAIAAAQRSQLVRKRR